MYHRVHSPVDGLIRAWRYVPGRLFPVNSLAVRHVESLFAVNERVSILIDTPKFGAVAVIMVGATNVGRMCLSFADLVTNTGQPGALTVPPAPHPHRARPGAGRVQPRLHRRAAGGGPAGCSRAASAPGQIVRMGQPLWRRP